MSQTIRVSLPGYNALTDTNVDHFALYSDADNILIKEKTRGTFNIGAGDLLTVEHNLGYAPFALAFGNVGSERHTIYGDKTDPTNAYMYVSTNYFYIKNDGASSLTGSYFIFYDQQI